MRVFAVLRWIAPGLFFVCVGVLVAVGVVSWRRTAPIRRGRGPPTHRPAVTARVSRTSLATAMPAVAGMAALAWASASRGAPLVRVTLASVGLLVALPGIVARVRAVESTSDEMVVRYAGRRPFRLAWSDVRELRPPRWPLGGWRVLGRSGSRTLMPSDLLGAECLLDAIVDRAGLRFAGREWRREPSADRGVSRTA